MLTKSRIVANSLTVTLMVFSVISTFYLVSTLRYQKLIIRRPDVVEAALTVERQEDTIIRQRIAQTRKETVAKILSPLAEAKN